MISLDPDVPQPTPEDEEIRQAFNLSPSADSVCFICGFAAVHPAILWSGITADIWLHHECAMRFVTGLFKDIREFDRLNALKASLKPQEGR